MVKELLIVFGLVAPDYSSAVAVNASYTLHTRSIPAPEKCCGLCKNGKIVHGDGHVTDCACQPGCSCKSKSVLVPECQNCLPPK